MIGERMKALRTEKGLTQAELARQLNLSATAISHYEAGLRTPNSDIIKMYALFFNVSTDYIFELSEFRNCNMDNVKTAQFIKRLTLLIAEYLSETETNVKNPEE